MPRGTLNKIKQVDFSLGSLGFPSSKNSSGARLRAYARPGGTVASPTVPRQGFDPKAAAFSGAVILDSY